MLNAAILASGNGSNAQRMFDLSAAGTLDMNIRLVLCNRPGARVLERARQAGLPALCLDHTTFPDRERFDRAMIDAICEAGADTVVLAGFMRMLTPAFLHAFPGRVINIHPALLPSFPGVHGAADANAYGVKISGCTVHFVDEILDHGAIIGHAAVPHLDGEDADALQQRIHTMEHRIYPQALQWLAEGRLVVEDRHIRLLPGNRSLATPPADALVWPPLEEGF